MGTFHVAVEVGNLTGERFEYVEALVDTGASHSIFPARLLRKLGVEPMETQRFRLADDSRREFNIGTARIRHGKVRHSVIVFGDDSMDPILGAVTREGFQLGVDPVGRRLIQVEGLLMPFISGPRP